MNMLKLRIAGQKLTYVGNHGTKPLTKQQNYMYVLDYDVGTSHREFAKDLTCSVP